MEHQQWQSLLKLGNHCFHEKEWSKAEYFYSEAYDLLAFSYRNNPMCADTLMAWVCSCHNLSALYEHQRNISLALRFLMVPHEYLLEVTNAKVDDEDIKLIAFKGLSLTLSPILLFNKKHVICDNCIDRFDSLKLLLQQQENVIH
ncbi:hypothetical protein Q4506_12190 [Colwellia sp. 4_MG-2023]|uniref:hypothetical protein n=1 Tax=unclassified Colwellia TaxID=196834 RepID=UPI0026E11E25|nr:MULTISPECIES: hypothetical protein [unclassified Colwellia]MDO6507849.1 hypothetical protein [Colwellia sp. 5_MG-2023]MDO6556448.1 hypothetical protein [Colwellia sp. 4_MG-2023]